MTAPHSDAADGGGPAFGPPPDSPEFRTFIWAIRRLDTVSYWVIAVAMALMSLILAAQVVGRYGLGSSIDAADELSRLFFVWSIFLAIPHGLKYGVHVGIDFFFLKMPYRMQAVLFRLIAAASGVLFVVLMVVSWTATVDKWQEQMPTLPMTAGLYYVAVLICCGHSLLHLMALAWGGPRTWEGETL